MSDSILITGGSGSLGKTLVKKLIGSRYDRIVVYSRSEHEHERMHAELKSDQVRYFIGDVRDKDRLRLAMRGCWSIIHAAALKVVPSGEYNPMEHIKTNILGSQNVIDIALENIYGTKKVLFISTDKAVNPINLYGATKLCMEKLALASNNLAIQQDSTRAAFSVCRYGNVANSNGSVIEIFKKQIRNNEPVTITDYEMTRYWIELEEATDFVIDSLDKMGSFSVKGGEIFIPEMPSFKIMDLARAFHYGDKEFPCKIIGIRPGEKLHEQIDVNKYSNINDNWLSWADLHDKLEKLGIIDTVKISRKPLEYWKNNAEPIQNS